MSWYVCIILTLSQSKLLTYVFLVDADIMTQEAPQVGDVLAAFHARALDKCKGIMETIAAGNPNVVGASGSSSAPTDGGKKRKRKGIASTTCSSHGTSK